MARAAISSVIHHGIVGGGSTLTQQLAKNALLTQKQTFSRKLEELFLQLKLIVFTLKRYSNDVLKQRLFW